MLSFFLSSFLIVILFTPFGIFIEKKKENSFYYLSKLLIYSSIIISFIALLLNFFSPINQILTSLLTCASFIITYRYRKIFFSLNYLKFIIFCSIIIIFFIMESNVYRPDAGLYHLPYIKILNEEKLIIGLSNLHFRYGHISIIQYFSAFSNNLIFGDNGIVYAQAIIFCSISINFGYQIYQYLKNKNFNIHFFYLFSTIIYIFYKMNRYSEYGNDGPAHLLFFFLISEILKNLNFHSSKQISNLFLISTFIFLNKTTLIFSFFFPFLAFKKKNFLGCFKNKQFYLSLIFLLLWSIKNVLVSGCILYPEKKTCFQNFSWTNIEEVEQIALSSEIWSKGWSDYNKFIKNKNIQKIDKKNYLENFYWLSYWLKVHFKHIINILIPFILFLITFYFLARLKGLKKSKIYSNNIFIYKLFFLLLICCAIWFLKFPIYRYGYSFLISLISVFFSIQIIKINFSVNYLRKLSFCFMIIFFSAFIVKNIVRINKSNNDYFNYPWPKYYSMSETNRYPKVKKVILNDKIFYESNNDYCMYFVAPCSHYLIKNNLILNKILGFNILYVAKN